VAVKKLYLPTHLLEEEILSSFRGEITLMRHVPSATRPLAFLSLFLRVSMQCSPPSSKLRHPNVVQFLVGLSQLPRLMQPTLTPGLKPGIYTTTGAAARN